MKRLLTAMALVALLMASPALLWGAGYQGGGEGFDGQGAAAGGGGASAHGDLTGVTTSQHHVKTVDTTAIENDAYGAGWEDDTTNGASLDALFDKLDAHDSTFASHTTAFSNHETKYGFQNDCAYIEAPEVEGLDKIFEVPNAATVTRVQCSTDAGTVDLNIENDGSTNILSAELVCDVGEQTSCGSGCDVDTVQGAQDNVAQYGNMNIDISDVTTAVVVRVCVYYTLD